MRFELSLFHKFFLLFWLPALVYIILMIFLPLKYAKVLSKRELTLPEEHKQLINYLQEVQRSSNFEKVELGVAQNNPFYKEILSNGSLMVGLAQKETLPKTFLRLSSILQTPERRVCIINDKPYYVGSVVEGYKIQKIEEFYVELKGPKGRIKLEVGGTMAF